MPAPALQPSEVLLTCRSVSARQDLAFLWIDVAEVPDHRERAVLGPGDVHVHAHGDQSGCVGVGGVTQALGKVSQHFDTDLGRGPQHCLELAGIQVEQYHLARRYHIGRADAAVE